MAPQTIDIEKAFTKNSSLATFTKGSLIALSLTCSVLLSYSVYFWSKQ
ncbi:hypothetical protein [Staphylococcus equorum]|nr:hypothetical protein [Staphylococcus equorum]MDK9864312.1 hypothetical protein [Staphylococcus equorum]